METVQAVATLADPNASAADKAMAAFDLASPVSSKEIGAAAGAARRAARRNCCFVAGTLIATADGMVPIEQIRVGDLVQAHDPETGETALKPVVTLFVNDEDSVWELTIQAADGSQEIHRVTDNHPYWTASHGWVEVGDLQPGDPAP